MGGVVGAISNKFILIAATLLFPARVGHDRVQAVFDPTAQHSAISETLADRLHIPHATPGALLRRPLSIGVGGEEFDQGDLAIGSPALGNGRDLIIGADIIGSHVFALDFRRKTIRLVVRSEYRAATQQLHAIELTHKADGWHLPVQVADHAPIRAKLDLGTLLPLQVDQKLISAWDVQDNAGLTVHSGETLIGTFVPTPSANGHDKDPIVLGLGALNATRLVLDLPHNRIWIQ